MLTAEYKYYVDWDDDGDFNDGYEDISAYVLSSSWRSGRSSAPPEYDTAGACSLTLDNSTSIFSSFNSSSPLYGLIRPNLRVRVAMKIGSGDEVIMWQGRLESLNPVVREVVGVSTAELTAYGPLAQFSEGEVEVALQENIATGDALDLLLDQDGWPAGDRAIDKGLSALSKWWIRSGRSRLAAMRELQDAEHGRLRESKDGKVVFESRDHIFNAPHDTPQAVYGTGTLNIWNLRQEDPLDGIYNLVRGQVRTFNVSEDVTLVTVSDVANEQGGTPPIIPAKVGGVPGTRTIWIEYPTPGSRSNYIAVNEWTTVDYEANTAADGSGSDITQYVSAQKTAYGPKLKIVFTNNSPSAAHLVVLRAHGVAIVEGDPIPVKSENSESQGKYRKREFPYPDPWMTDLNDAQDYCDYILSIYANPRPRLTFDVMGNYDSNHLAEVQAREIGDRIRVVAGEAFGLYLDAEFIIDSLAHSVDQARRHVMTVSCTLAPTEQLAATGTAYTPKVIPEPTVEAEVPRVPDQLWLTGLVAGSRIIFAAMAKKWNAGIVEAELRIKLVPSGQTLDYVDLRTYSEGGDFEDNGTTQFILSLAAGWQGVRHQLFYGENTGRWYWAVRFRNEWGWSVWSDGNDEPQYVKDYVDTDADSFSDTGPPADWAVSIQPGPQSGTAVVIATRPITNGKRIWFAFFQIKDISTGSWRAVDEDIGAAVTRYDGSETDHTYDPATGQITKESGDFGDAATYGGLILMDMRQGQFSREHCIWMGVSPDQIVGNTITGIIGAQPAFQPGEDGRYTQIRLKIVRPPWEWDSEGYLGQTGYQAKEYFDNATRGDLISQTFKSDPFVIPSGLDIEDIEGRVWFGNTYSFHDDSKTGAGAQQALPLEMPPGLFTDFTDGRIWERHPSPWWGLNPSKTKLTVTSAVAGVTQGSLLMAAGLIFRPIIIPNESGEIEVTVRIQNFDLGASTSSIRAGWGLLLARGAGGGSGNVDLIFFGPGRYGTGVLGGTQPQLVLYQFLQLETTTGSAFISSASAGKSVIDLKLTVEPGDPNTSSSFAKIRLYAALDGGGYSEITWGGSPSAMYLRRIHLVSGHRFGVFAASDYLQPAMSAEISDFRVVKGIILAPNEF